MKNNKVYKGFELVYWNLSYRRKFIRNIKSIPFCIVILAFMWFLSGNSMFNIISTIIIITFITQQSIYTYIKWKEGE